MKEPVKCPICGRFMRRIGLISKIRIVANGGGERTHICKKETYTYTTNIWEHEK